MKVLNEVKLEIPARSINEGYARVAVAALAAQLDPTVSELTEIKTAVSEAVTNCIVHAYENGPGRIYITARILEERTFMVSIKDRGVGIENVSLAMEPMYTSKPGDERSGMGFTIMQSFMDKVRVSSRPGRGTRVTMLKRLAPRD